MFSDLLVSDTRRKESWSVSHTLAICKYWQRMWTIVTSPSCFLASAVIKDSPRRAEVNDGRRQILCSRWGHLYRLPIHKVGAAFFILNGNRLNNCTATTHACEHFVYKLLVSSSAPQFVYYLRGHIAWAKMLTLTHSDQIIVKWPNKQFIEEPEIRLRTDVGLLPILHHLHLKHLLYPVIP